MEIRLHHEGILILVGAFLLLVLLNVVVYWLVKPTNFFAWLLPMASLLFFLFLLWFFRNPLRPFTPDDSLIISPADGEIVVVKKVFEPEYFNDERLQVSIFMSPLNVHVNRYAISGTVVFSAYHPGSKLVAWHPKASSENERSSVVIKDARGREILVRQIAGAVARRVVCYAKEGAQVLQGEDMGFIKFGSRVDLFLPLNTNLSVKEGDNVVGNVSAIALW
ncbi:MAG: phosphatidylserine decarboxylase family protein [Bacteroidales bacterium]